MWLFAGRYRNLGPAIFLIALATASIAVVFLVVAFRLARRRVVKVPNLVNLLLIGGPAVVFGEVTGFGEPVFVSGHLNRGAALFTAILAIVIGIAGVAVSKRMRVLRILLLVMAAGILAGDLAGWLRRSAAPSKFDAVIAWPASAEASPLPRYT